MTSPAVPRKRTDKGAQTRARILEAAIELFRERGYDGTTMRGIADRAGVSLGNAYYYFKSKEVLVQDFYRRSHTEHLDSAERVLATETHVEARLRGVLLTKIETSEPYHRFSGVLFKTAADPESPLSPFSEESAPSRRESTRLMERVIEGKGLRTTPDLRAELPDLLWTYQMGIILFWIHDRSEGRKRTRILIDRTVPLVIRIVNLGSLPVIRTLTRRATAFLRELRDAREIPPTPAD